MARGFLFDSVAASGYGGWTNYINDRFDNIGNLDIQALGDGNHDIGAASGELYRFTGLANYDAVDVVSGSGVVMDNDTANAGVCTMGLADNLDTFLSLVDSNEVYSISTAFTWTPAGGWPPTTANTYWRAPTIGSNSGNRVIFADAVGNTNTRWLWREGGVWYIYNEASKISGGNPIQIQIVVYGNSVYYYYKAYTVGTDLAGPEDASLTKRAFSVLDQSDTPQLIGLDEMDYSTDSPWILNVLMSLAQGEGATYTVHGFRVDKLVK